MTIFFVFFFNTRRFTGFTGFIFSCLINLFFCQSILFQYLAHGVIFSRSCLSPATRSPTRNSRFFLCIFDRLTGSHTGIRASTARSALCTRYRLLLDVFFLQLILIITTVFLSYRSIRIGPVCRLGSIAAFRYYRYTANAWTNQNVVKSVTRPE